ncbi:lysostaphin resistance A-like protein [Niallia sp. Krafla_26]|uniref:CPBP family intramembrane glutamic endopeptidase n=1 Tax=Niallia sp. Krafla_26 TaxID=3064703 RepID=UPI003D180F18
MRKNDRELLKTISDKELLHSLYLTQLLIVIISIILGIFLFNDFDDFVELFVWDFKQILLWGGIAGVTVFLFDLTLMKVLPPNYYDDGGLNERIFQGRSIFQIAWIAALVSIAEEILFRGVIQTHVGLVISSMIFAVVHFRYLFNWYLFLNVIGLSFLIGFIYGQTENLLVTIFMHFLIDFLLGCAITFNFPKKEQKKGL